MFRYKLHYQDGSEAGGAAYADSVNPGDELMLGPGKFVRVLDVVTGRRGEQPVCRPADGLW